MAAHWFYKTKMTTSMKSSEKRKEVALKHELPLAYKNDIASISFPTTKEGQKSLAQCIQRVKLVAFTHQELLQWYHSNKL